MKPHRSHTRAVLKVSGEAFAPEGGRGLDEEHVGWLARELAAGREVCPELAVVVGGGNIMRGAKFQPDGAGRIRADYAGMIATIVNALILKDALEQSGLPCAVYSALPVEGVVSAFCVDCCQDDLAHGRLVILAGGTGNPLFTTDTAASLRAVQLGAKVLLKATRVRGVYSADPEKDAGAELFEHLSYQDVLARRLGVMDLCAISMCMEHALPVRVFNYKEDGNIRRALSGEPIGTLIGNRTNGR